MKSRLMFAHLPTPVEQLPNLSKALGINLIIKRDDQTGLAMGGNKTRKLEYLLAEAQANGANMLITAGAVQSNHCRQTAAAAAKFGMACMLVLMGDAPADAEGNFLLDQLMGAHVVYTTSAQRDETLKRVFDEAWKAGLRPYLIPYGGSNATGALGYVHAMQELQAQNCAPDWIVFASSSGGTQAGLVVGARLTGYTGKILGISVDEPLDVLCPRVAALASQTADGMGYTWHFSADEISANADYCKAGYGVMTPHEKAAIQLFAQTEAILLDPVYTARAAAGLIDLAKQGMFRRDDVVLFWHTGGTPALFAAPYRQQMAQAA